MTLTATPILSPQQAEIAALSDTDLGAQIWATWQEERTGHPARRKATRQMLRTLANEALRRGHRVLAEQFTLGQPVREHDRDTVGAVVEFGHDGSVLVDYPCTASRSGLRRVHYLCTSLLDGSLVAA